MVSTKLVLMIFITLAVFATQAQSREKKKTSCAKGRTPLSGIFCGRGPTRQDCPSGYQCIIAPDDTSAVCCPVLHNKRTSNEKPGSCPSSKGQGICVVECEDDSSCDGNKKCCGGCPRRCVSPDF